MAQNIDIIIRAMDRATPAIRSTESSLRSLGKTSSFVGDTLKFFAQAQVFGGLMALQAGLVGSVGAGIKFNSSMELAKMRWTELTGSASKGQGMVDMILRVAKETSFTTDQINNYATQLSGAGVKSEDLESKLMGLANITAKYGLTTDQAQNAIRGYVQAIGKGKISVEELNQMQENGIPIYEILRQELGLTSEEIQGAGKDAKTSAKIIDFLNNKFLDGRGAIDAYGRTFAGRLDKMKDTFTVFAGVVTKPIFDKLKEGMKTVTDYMDTMMQKMQEGKGFLESLATSASSPAWNNFATVLGVIAGLGVWKVLGMAVPKILSLVKAVRSGGTAFTILRSAISPIGAIITGVSVVVGFLVKSFVNAYKKSAELKSQIETLKKILTIIGGTFTELGSQIMDYVNKQFEGENATVRWENAMAKFLSILKTVAIGLGYFADVIMFTVKVLFSIGYALQQTAYFFQALYYASQGEMGKMKDAIANASESGKKSIQSMQDAFTQFSVENSIGAKVERELDRIERKGDTTELSFEQNMLNMKNDMLNTGASMGTTAETTGNRINSGLMRGSQGAQVLASGLESSASRAKASMTGLQSTAGSAGTAISLSLAKGGQGGALLATRIASGTSSANTAMGGSASKASSSGGAIKTGLSKGGEGAKLLESAIKQAQVGSGSSMSSIASKASSTSSSVSKSGKSGGDGFKTGITSGSKQANTGLASDVKGMVSSASRGATSLGREGSKGGKGLANGVKTGSSVLPTYVRGVITAGANIIQATNWGGLGSKLISTFASGISKASSFVSSAVGRVMAEARRLLPGSDAKEGALSDLTHSGYMLPVTFAQGIARGTGSAVLQAERLASQVDASLQSEVGARMFASGQSLTVYHRHDGTVNVNGSGLGQADQFVAGSIGYEVGTDGVRQAIRSRTGGRQ